MSSFLAVSGLAYFLMGAAATSCWSDPPGEAPASPAAKEAAPDVDRPTESRSPTAANRRLASERLEAAKKLYREAKTYRDEGMLMLEMNTQGEKVVSQVPFATAFERGGRFRWQFRQSCVPGEAPDQRYTIWSDDGHAFSSWWTTVDEGGHGQRLEVPLARATGVSKGLAVAVIPLLEMSEGGWGDGGIIDCVVGPVAAGREDVDTVACVRIEGELDDRHSRVTLWIDDSGLIRKILKRDYGDYSALDKEAAPATPQEALEPSFATTIQIKPFVNEGKIEDAKFKPDEKNPDPAK